MRESVSLPRRASISHLELLEDGNTCKREPSAALRDSSTWADQPWAVAI